jgi:hypothetical protein
LFSSIPFGPLMVNRRRAVTGGLHPEPGPQWPAI